MTRSRFRVDQPQPNDLIGDPLLVAGTGSGFEATIDIRVLDGNGKRAPADVRPVDEPALGVADADRVA